MTNELLFITNPILDGSRSPAVCGCVGAAHARSEHQRMSAKVSGEVKDVELLKDEVGGLMMEFGITTLTFYKGDYASARKALRDQFAKVVASNPWLAGRLVKSKTGIRLRVPAEPISDSDIDPLFTSDTGSAFKLEPTAPYDKICADMYKSKTVIVGNGYSLAGKDKPLTILTLAESAPGEFALVFSLSHAVADGKTYYDVFKMLQPGAAVRELSTTRVMSFSETMRDACGRKEMAWVDKPATGIMLTLAMAFNSKAKCVAFDLDAERLAAAKAAGAAEGGVPYVTTNDILTCGFFNACGSRIGMMGMDCRGRLEGIDQDMAGNYVTALVLGNDVFETPATLRKMYATTPYQVTKRPLPKCCGGLKKEWNFGMVTNWSSFAGGLVALEGCEMVIHLPVMNHAYIAWDMMIPFARGVGKLGVICWTVSTDEAGLRKALPVGDCVSKELFPSQA